MIALGLICLPIAAHATTLDFEDLSLGLDLPPIAYVNAGGTGIDVTLAADHLSVADTFSSKGNALLSQDPNRSPLTITFSGLINNFSLDTGDFGADDDSPVIIQLYDASDNLLDTVSQPWDASMDISNGPYLHLASLATGVKKVVFSSGGQFPNSMYVDNVSFSANAVPEPATMAILGLGSLALLRKRRIKTS